MFGKYNGKHKVVGKEIAKWKSVWQMNNNFPISTTSVQLNIRNLSSEPYKWPNATNYGLVVEYMDRAQGATQGFLPQNLHGTHTSSAKSSGRRYVAAALLGDGHATWHLATSAEAVDRGLTMRSSDWYCSPESGE